MKFLKVIYPPLATCLSNTETILCLPQAEKKGEIGSNPSKAAPGQLYQNDKMFWVSAAPLGRLWVGLPEALRGEGGERTALPGASQWHCLCCR